MPEQRSGAAVEIAGLRREYQAGQGHVVAIEHLDLRVAPGEFLCIVGPSGCGKSTLLRILAGLDKQSSGAIRVDAAGWPVQNAMVFQESGLFPWMNVEKTSMPAKSTSMATNSSTSRCGQVLTRSPCSRSTRWMPVWRSVRAQESTSTTTPPVTNRKVWAEPPALATTEVEGAHRRALVAEVTRRALVEAGRA